MKYATKQSKSSRQTDASPRDSAVGRDGVSIAPPESGIDLVDRGVVGAVQRMENRTGLPDKLKAGIEGLSGYSMNDVIVHYNSSRPAQLRALAYTQGTEIDVGRGEDRHLAHEAWHAVQQMQGRVKPTMQDHGMSINDDEGLEREADSMGARALHAIQHNADEKRARSAGMTSHVQANHDVTHNELTRRQIERVHGQRLGQQSRDGNAMRSAGKRAAPVIQKVVNKFLQTVSDVNRRIDYTALPTITKDEIAFENSLTTAVERVRGRQAVLEGMTTAGITPQVEGYFQTHPNEYIGSLASTGMDIRSSHSGGIIDPNLPQSYYDISVAPGGVVPNAPPRSTAPSAQQGTVRGQANFSWLKDSTTSHTTDAQRNLPQDLNRVASYFELELKGVGGFIDGARLVYDPFNDRYFVSEHYADEFEIVNVLPVTAHADYQKTINVIQKYINTYPQPDWSKLIQAFVRKFYET